MAGSDGFRIFSTEDGVSLEVLDLNLLFKGYLAL
jgi:hypothetical protein